MLQNHLTGGTLSENHRVSNKINYALKLRCSKFSEFLESKFRTGKRAIQRRKVLKKKSCGRWSILIPDTSAGTGKLCILGHLGLVFIWSCFVSCLLFLLFYVSLRNLCSGTCRKIPYSFHGMLGDRTVSLPSYSPLLHKMFR